MWIGLTGQEFEDLYQWSDGTFMDFTSWDEGEPGNWGGDEDCGGFMGENWHDIGCEAELGYICA